MTTEQGRHGTDWRADVHVINQNAPPPRPGRNLRSSILDMAPRGWTYEMDLIIIFIYTRWCQLQRRVVLYRTDIWLVYLRTNTPQHRPNLPWSKPVRRFIVSATMMSVTAAGVLRGLRCYY